MSFQLFHDYARPSGFGGAAGAYGTGGAIAAGTLNPDYPGCRWDPALNDYACDDGYTLSGAPLPLGYQFLISAGGPTVPINGRVYQLPAGIAFPPAGWYVWSNGAAEQWLISVGAQVVGGAPLSQTEINQLITAPSDSQVAAWQQEQAALNATNSPGGVDLTALKQLARAGGAAAEGALQTLAANGDLIAKLALTLGIGYAAAAIIPWAGGGLIVFGLLFKR